MMLRKEHQPILIYLHGAQYAQVHRMSGLVGRLMLHVRLCATHRRQPARLPVPGILQARTLEWVAISFSDRKSVV